MAKKGAVLQTEVNSDEEWLKILQRPGLVLVDVYSDWSGPCAGMVSVLKKIKMEAGGDDLSYAIAKSDNIGSLSRFRGRSEPTWMFIQGGHSVNIAFGANCPELTELLIREIHRVQKNEPPEFSVPVDEISEKEAIRMADVMAARNAKEAEIIARREEAAKKRYEAYIEHLKVCLRGETVLIMFPWCFQDEDGNKRDKKSSPQYVEMVDSVLSGKFSIEQEIRRTLDEEVLEALEKEANIELADETKRMLLDDFAFVFRLKLMDSRYYDDVDGCLIDAFYDEPIVPEHPYQLRDHCFVQRHLPAQYLIGMVESSSTLEEDMHESSNRTLLLTTVWIPLNIRNRVMVFRTLFQKYVDTNFPYEEVGGEAPIMLFKYDSTKKNELQEVYEAYSSEVVNFGVFARDKPDPVLIAETIPMFDRREEKTGYEIFVAVVKKVNNEAFLSFAGIGPYHVSENPEAAMEELKIYFSTMETKDEGEEEGDLDDDMDHDLD